MRLLSKLRNDLLLSDVSMTRAGRIGLLSKVNNGLNMVIV